MNYESIRGHFYCDCYVYAVDRLFIFISDSEHSSVIKPIKHMKKWYYSSDLDLIESFLDEERHATWKKMVQERKKYWRSVGMLSEELIIENAINDASKVYVTFDQLKKKIKKMKEVANLAVNRKAKVTKVDD